METTQLATSRPHPFLGENRSGSLAGAFSSDHRGRERGRVESSGLRHLPGRGGVHERSISASCSRKAISSCTGEVPSTLSPELQDAVSVRSRPDVRLLGIRSDLLSAQYSRNVQSAAPEWPMAFWDASCRRIRSEPPRVLAFSCFNRETSRQHSPF